MNAPRRVEYRRRPHVVASLAGTAYRAPRPAPVVVPPLAARWLGCRVRPRDLERFRELTGLRDETALALLYPHVMGFPLLRAVLTQPAIPLALRSSLQVRNHLLLHRSFDLHEPLELNTRVTAQRLLVKGLEVDLHSTADATVHGDRTRVWESLVTMYYRGAHGSGGAASPLARPPASPEPSLSAWRLATGARWLIVRQTGDFNPLHWSSAYARMTGFRGATLHAQRVIAECLARLPAGDASATQRLDVWLRGPFTYGAQVRLHADCSGQPLRFALVPEDDPRPGVIGLWNRAAAAPLVDTAGQPLPLRPDATA